MAPYDHLQKDNHNDVLANKANSNQVQQHAILKAERCKTSTQTKLFKQGKSDKIEHLIKDNN